MLTALDEEQQMIYEMFGLSVSGGGFGGLSADYAVCADYANKYGLDRVECYRVIKAMIGAYDKTAARKKGKGKR
jgi:hypothetical protein